MADTRNAATLVLVALYARVSTAEQERGYSLSTQIEALRAEAEKVGAHIVAEITEDYSGASLDRPGLERLRDLAKAKQINMVLVYDLDRFARKAVHQMLLEEELKKYGVEVYYLVGQYDDSPEGRLQKQVKAAISEYEREKILERSKRGKRGRLKAGYVLVSHAKCPYGYIYKSEPHKGYLVVVDEQAEIIRQIFEMILDGKSPRIIARHLNDSHIPSPTGGHWWHTSVFKVVHNETYCGTWHFNKTAHVGRKPRPREEWIPVEVPAIVSRETWEKAQRIIAHRLAGRPPQRYVYLFRGRIWCESCGKRMVGEHSHGKPYYSCPRNDLEYKHDRCTQVTVRADVLEERVWLQLAELLQSPEILLERYRNQDAVDHAEIARFEGYLASIAEKIETAKKKERRFAELYAEGHITKDHYLEERSKIQIYLESLEREQTALTTELQQRTLTQQQEEAFDEFCTRIKDYIENPSFEKKSQVLSRLEINVWIKGKHARVMGIVPLGELDLQDKLDTTS